MANKAFKRYKKLHTYLIIVSILLISAIFSPIIAGLGALSGAVEKAMKESREKAKKAIKKAQADQTMKEKQLEQTFATQAKETENIKELEKQQDKIAQETKEKYKKADQEIESRAQLTKIINNSDSFLSFQISPSGGVDGKPRLPIHPYVSGEEQSKCVWGEVIFELKTPIYYIRPARGMNPTCQNNCSILFLQGCAIPTSDRVMIISPADGSMWITLYEQDNKICYKSFNKNTSQEKTDCVKKQGKTNITVTINADFSVTIKPTYEKKPAGSVNEYTVKNGTSRKITVVYDIASPCGSTLKIGAGNVPQQNKDAGPGETATWKAACPLISLNVQVFRPNGQLIQRYLDWKGPLSEDGYWIVKEIDSNNFTLEKE